jgi:hypothetical protein
VPEFVKNNPKLLEAWTKKWEEIVTNSFDIEDVIKIKLKKLFLTKK